MRSAAPFHVILVALVISLASVVAVSPATGQEHEEPRSPVRLVPTVPLPQPRSFYNVSIGQVLTQARVVEASAMVPVTASTTVGVIDDGINTAHPVFEDVSVTGFAPQNQAWDSTEGSHGTAVTSVIVGENSGQVGACPASVCSDIVFGAHGGLELIQETVDRGATVINMSWNYDESVGLSSYMREAIEYAEANDVVLVAAAGNENTDGDRLPPSHPNVISVGCINSNDERVSYSNFGSWVDVTAGCERHVADAAGGMTYTGGTSLATPLVTAVVAMVQATFPDLSAAQVRETLFNSAVPLENDGSVHGKVDAVAALQYAATLSSSYPTSLSTVQWSAQRGAGNRYGVTVDAVSSASGPFVSTLRVSADGAVPVSVQTEGCAIETAEIVCRDVFIVQGEHVSITADWDAGESSTVQFSLSVDDGANVVAVGNLSHTPVVVSAELGDFQWETTKRPENRYDVSVAATSVASGAFATTLRVSAAGAVPLSTVTSGCAVEGIEIVCRDVSVAVGETLTVQGQWDVGNLTEVVFVFAVDDGARVVSSTRVTHAPVPEPVQFGEASFETVGTTRTRSKVTTSITPIAGGPEQMAIWIHSDYAVPVELPQGCAEALFDATGRQAIRCDVTATVGTPIEFTSVWEGPHTFSVALLNGVTFGLLGSTQAQTAWEPVESTRVFGETRVETAVAASQWLFPGGGVDTVVLARSRKAADSLAGTPLAISLGAPLLLSESDVLHPAVEAELGRLLGGSGRVVLLGGPVALSPAVEDRLVGLGYEVVRYGGETRVETAALISAQVPSDGRVFVVDGEDWASAMAAGATGSRVLLTTGDVAHGVTLDGVTGASEVIAVGASYGLLEAAGVSGLVRVDASDSVEKSVEIARLAGFSGTSRLVVSSSTTFADGLAGGVVASRLGAPLVLVGEQVDSSVVGLVDPVGVEQAVLMGGPVAIPSSVDDQITTLWGR